MICEGCRIIYSVCERRCTFMTTGKLESICCVHPCFYDMTIKLKMSNRGYHIRSTRVYNIFYFLCVIERTIYTRMIVLFYFSKIH